MLKSIHEAAGSTLGEYFSYNHFRCAWYSYMKLLAINYDEGFQCTKCGANPSTVVMDGTAIAFRKELDSWRDILLSDDVSRSRSVEDK